MEVAFRDLTSDGFVKTDRVVWIEKRLKWLIYGSIRFLPFVS